jgi:hypothetical protein
MADGVVLNDNSAIRFSPVSPDRLAPVTPGVQLVAAGPAYSNQLRANLIYLPAQLSVVSFQPASATPASQQAGTIVPELKQLEDMSRVQTILRGASGQVDVLVLQDGASVRIPETLQPSIPPTLMAGAVVDVKGQGAVYPRGTALEASSFSLATR